MLATESVEVSPGVGAKLTPAAADKHQALNRTFESENDFVEVERSISRVKSMLTDRLAKERMLQQSHKTPRPVDRENRVPKSKARPRAAICSQKKLIQIVKRLSAPKVLAHSKQQVAVPALKRLAVKSVYGTTTTSQVVRKLGGATYAASNVVLAGKGSSSIKARKRLLSKRTVAAKCI